MKKQILGLLFGLFCIFCLNGCAIEQIQRPAHSIFIDSMNIEKNLYLGLDHFMKLEIFFLRKKYFSWNPKAKLNMLLADGYFKVQKLKDVVGQHVYQIFYDHRVEDQIFIPPLVTKAFFIVKRNEKIIHHRIIEIDPVITRSIYIKFLGNDFSIKFQ